MRFVVVVLALALLMAGCAQKDGKSNSNGSSTTSSSSTTTGLPANGTGLPPTTSSGIPIVNVQEEMDVVLNVTTDGKVGRVRLVAFKDFTVDQVNAVNSGGGGGGGGGQAQGGYGIAVFAQDAVPAIVCSDAAEAQVWDQRIQGGDTDWSLKAGVYDLWAWSSGPARIRIELNGGGDDVNATLQAHNWTATATEIAVVKSSPVMATADFDQAVPMPKGGVVMGRYAPPNGIPEETTALKVTQNGGDCAVGASTGGGGFGGGAYVASAFVAPGEATLSGRYAATLSIIGEPSADLVTLAPA